ncbi:SDR family NAD(P)-dependent oxidoreductase [Ensifer sp.]|jgi:short-subunit dehydrogenase|uniref:SDR family NAD(P)-dependent oxidoreductase n=1 Tax=Ensifer sp. TaxID=1872086 RepID=UPI002E10A566|nr:SDR family NAD(P)-dependent oxidoreductase [Ensifer sp.]
MGNGDNRTEDAQQPKVAWLTGASSGIGRALALRLAQQGWTVAASARNRTALEELVSAQPSTIHAYELDVTDRPMTANVVAAIETKLAPISLAAFCAGTYRHETLQTFDAAIIGEMFALNVMGTVNCLEAIMPRMVARRAGRIAVTASVSGYTGLPGAAGYGATKAALINMCEALYPELERSGVRMVLINPGFVDTPLTRKNDFPMPFLISSEEAADHILRGLADERFEIAFPWKMKLAMGLLRALPARLRFSVTRRMLR